MRDKILTYFPTQHFLIQFNPPYQKCSASTVLFFLWISVVGLAWDCESRRAVESMLLVRWRLGERWSLQRNEPAWVVGEHRQLIFVILPCLASPPVFMVDPDVGETTWVISTFKPLLTLASVSIAVLQLLNTLARILRTMINEKRNQKTIILT